VTEIQGQLLHAPQTAATSDDYYTPRWIFDRMDLEFDIDVCAPEGGVEWIPALRYFARSDDGLSQPWVGRVWMNPPFSKPSPWVDRFIEHRSGVALCPFAKSGWFDRLWSEADAIVPMQSSLLVSTHLGLLEARSSCPCSWPRSVTSASRASLGLVAV
jgi:hypothetical protein